MVFPNGGERMGSESPLHERLAAVAGPRTFRAIAELTGTNSETVRRYMQGQTPSVEFLASLCNAFKINGEWLLCGRGPMKAEDVKTHALKAASGAELLGALATAVERLTERMDRVEVHMQLLETRMRGRENLAAASHSLPERPDEQATPAAAEHAGSNGAAGTSRAGQRARRVADVVAKRSREDAD
jgi:transcriptional regulator with XRE-family HTH domain